MFAIAERCPLLKELNVSFCWRLTNAGIIAIARSCPQLENLGMDGCEWLREEAVISVAENCPNLWGFGIEFMDGYEAEWYPAWKWLRDHVEFARFETRRPPGTRPMRDILVAHPPPWL